jgi:hypothetical protein
MSSTSTSSPTAPEAPDAVQIELVAWGYVDRPMPGGCGLCEAEWRTCTSGAPGRGFAMTYFNFKHIRGTHSEAVYAGSTILGRVALKADWRSRLTVSLNDVNLHYRAVGLGGEVLPGLFLSRHDAAEALYEAANAAPEGNGRVGIDEP